MGSAKDFIKLTKLTNLYEMVQPQIQVPQRTNENSLAVLRQQKKHSVKMQPNQITDRTYETRGLAKE